MGYRVAGVCAAAMLVACADSPSEPEGDSSSSSIVAKLLADTAVVYPDRLEFPKGVFPATLRARIDSGQEKVVLVGDRALQTMDPSGRLSDKAGNPYGYLR